MAVKLPFSSVKTNSSGKLYFTDLNVTPLPLVSVIVKVLSLLITTFDSTPETSAFVSFLGISLLVFALPSVVAPSVEFY